MTFLRILLLLAYPPLVYLCLDGERWVLLPVLVLLLAPRLLRAVRRSRLDVRTMILPLAALAGALILARTVGPRFVFLSIPVVMNISLLAAFASTLFTRQSMAERFARAQVDDLSKEEVTYCTSVTVAWCIFFTLNAGLTAGLSAWASLEAWTLYTGLIAYLLMGALFAAEYLVRKIRFRRFDETWLDRQLLRILPGPNTP